MVVLAVNGDKNNHSYYKTADHVGVTNVENLQYEINFPLTGGC